MEEKTSINGFDFKALEDARMVPREGRPHGHTIKEVCDILGVTEVAYYYWRTGKVERPRAGILAAIKRYIAGAGG